MKYELNNLAKGIVNLMLTVVGVLLGLRFILKLFSADATNDFVNWIYETSGEILGPFRGIFPSPNLDGFVIEFSTIFALVIYAILGMLAFYVIDLLTPEKGR
jgi:YggT family protein